MFQVVYFVQLSYTAQMKDLDALIKNLLCNLMCPKFLYFLLNDIFKLKVTLLYKPRNNYSVHYRNLVVEIVK